MIYQYLKFILSASTALAITTPAMAIDKAAEHSQTSQSGMERKSGPYVVPQAKKLTSIPVVDREGNDFPRYFFLHCVEE